MADVVVSDDGPGVVMAVFLDVPFADKDEAKRFGARWDPQARRWFVPHGVDPAPFGRWIRREPRQGALWVPARVWLVPDRCWKCGVRGTWPMGITLDETVGEHPAGQLVEITFCAEALAAAASPEWLQSVGAGPIEYRYSRTAGGSSWTNTCRSCRATIGSWFLVHEVLPELASEGLLYEDLPSRELAIPAEAL
jgi:hypothetical protein